MLILGDLVVIERDGEEVARRTVEGRGRFPDGAEVVYLYDKGDDCFGYAVNLDWPDGSEWGYPPSGG